jgi:hypothetical protein
VTLCFLEGSHCFVVRMQRGGLVREQRQVRKGFARLVAPRVVMRELLVGIG